MSKMLFMFENHNVSKEEEGRLGTSSSFPNASSSSSSSKKNNVEESLFTPLLRTRDLFVTLKFKLDSRTFKNIFSRGVLLLVL